MTISARIEATIEHWSGLWKDRLGAWAASFVNFGMRSFTDQLEPDVIAHTREVLELLRDNEALPDPYKRAIDKALQEGNLLDVAAGWAWLIVGLIPTLLSAGAPTARLVNYQQEILTQSYRLDPATVIALMRRFPGKYPFTDMDLAQQGISAERLQALLDATLYYPTPQDLVTWTAREVFEPDSISKYGLADEFDKLDLSLFAGAGVSEEQARNYWIAHWQHATYNQVVEMLHRGLLTEADVYDWYRLVEVPPYWRDKMTAIAYNVPTRVDVRRFYDLKTIDETRLREIYTAMGYHDKDLDDYVLWTKIYVELPDLISRWKNGWITLDDARARLIELGMDPQAAEELVQTKVKVAETTPSLQAKELTKTEIYKGVKVGRLTRAEGVQLLQLLEYTQAQAEFLLDINVPEDETTQAVADRQLTKTDILAGLKAGVITRDEAYQRLVELRYTALDAEFLLKIYDSQVEPPSDPKLKEASKADIVAGVKQGLITAEEGYLMLINLGYSAEGAQFILTVRAESSPFSPANYSEFVDRVEKYRRAAGLEVKTMPQELKDAADQVLKLTNDVERLQGAVKQLEDQVIIPGTSPESITRQLDGTRAELANAEISLAEARTRYETELAKWHNA